MRIINKFIATLLIFIFTMGIFVDNYTVKAFAEESTKNNREQQIQLGKGNEKVLKAAEDDYIKVSVKDPEGNPVVNGFISNNSMIGVGKIQIVDGFANIPKDFALQDNEYFYLKGTNSNGVMIMYTDIKISINTVEIRDTTSNKIFLKTNVPSDSSNIRLNLYKKMAMNNNYSIYEDSYYNLDEFYKDYKSTYIWTSASYEIIGVNIIKDDKSIGYIMADTIANGKNINLDYTNTMDIKVNTPNNYKVSLVVSIGNRQLETLYNNPKVIKYSQNVINGYRAYYQDNNKNTFNYYKNLEEPLKGSSYNLNIGDTYKVKAEYYKTNSVDAYKTAQTVLTILDEYNNSIIIKSADGNSPYKNVVADISDGGKVVDSITKDASVSGTSYNVKYTPNVTLPTFDVTLKMNILGKSYVSNSLNYLFDMSKYTEVKVKDQQGRPLKSGELLFPLTNAFKINDGSVYILTKLMNNSTAAIRGINADGEYVLSPEIKLYSSTTAINLEGNRVEVDADLSNIPNITSGHINVYSKKSVNLNHLMLDWEATNKGVANKLFVWIQGNDDYYYEDEIVAQNDYKYIIGKKFNYLDSIIDIKTDNLTEVKFSGGMTHYFEQFKNSPSKTGAESYEKLFMSQNTFILTGVYIYTKINGKNELEYCDLKKVEYINGRYYTPLLGKNFYMDNKIDKYLNKGQQISVLYTCRDEYGDYFPIEGSFDFEINLVDSSGTVVKKLAKSVVNGGQYFTVPTDIPSGFYSANIVTYSNNQKVAERTIDGVYVAGGVSYNIGKSEKSTLVSVYDMDKNIYTMDYDEMNEDLYLPGEILSGSKEYYLSTFKKKDTGIVHEKNKVQLVKGSLQKSAYSSVKLKLNGGIKKLILNNRSDSMSYDAGNTDSIDLQLVLGETYNLSAYCEDAQGGYWVEKIIEATDNLSEVTLDRNDLRKVTLNSKFSNYAEIMNVIAKNNLTGKTYELDRNINTEKNIYLPKGAYDFTFTVKLNNSNSFNEYKKSIDITNNNGVINIGDKLSYDIVLDKSSYSTGDKVIAKLANVKDGDIKLTGYENSVIEESEVKIDLMHGAKVLKTFEGQIPSSIKGDCSLAIRGNILGLGEVSSKPVTLSIINSENIKEGDINLDGIVDIFDLVYITRDFGKSKGQGDYDARVNLQTTDDVIDIKDLAKAASNYEK
ncbi:hypothetical protein CSC2_44860 [Clostridium zeae]|uniref:Dockerin domain-containing protein n=1 Tax=Clostridium zeae TaxID=2759022 RepID=A0ABQ1EH56_9CLOT|nr:hypothetical protein [Clostridium zeae]GFZ33960.1 hypothetical protein CSC2_44860 [Clostridium zeae]